MISCGIFLSVQCIIASIYVLEAYDPCDMASINSSGGSTPFSRKFLIAYFTTAFGFLRKTCLSFSLSKASVIVFCDSETDIPKLLACRGCFCLKASNVFCKIIGIFLRFNIYTSTTCLVIRPFLAIDFNKTSGTSG